MTFGPLAFAVPGDLSTISGGYIYDRRLMKGLRDLGHIVQHLELPATFPNPTHADARRTFDQLRAIDKDIPLIIDGLAYGAIPTQDLAKVPAPLVALVHHPLAKESGIDAATRERLYENERDNLTFAQHVLVPSPHTAAILETEYGIPKDKVTIIRPGSEKPVRQSVDLDPLLILSVGIQAPRKGHDVLLKALSHVSDLPWVCVIVGPEHDQKHANDLKVLRDRLQLNDRVNITGQISSERLAEFYQRASVFALATRYEGYGIVFDEALAHGLPIVSCATGAVPDTVPPETGHLVPSEAPEKFASALRSLLLDPTEREKMGNAARLASTRLPDWNDTARLASDAIKRAIRRDA